MRWSESSRREFPICSPWLKSGRRRSSVGAGHMTTCSATSRSTSPTCATRSCRRPTSGGGGSISVSSIFSTPGTRTPELVVSVLKLLETLPIQAVIYEDVRGTHFPFQTAELVKLIRRYTLPPRLILVHPHSGNGLEDALHRRGSTCGRGRRLGGPDSPRRAGRPRLVGHAGSRTWRARGTPTSPSSSSWNG